MHYFIQERVPGVPRGNGGTPDQPVHGYLWYHLMAGRRDRRQVIFLHPFSIFCFALLKILFFLFFISSFISKSTPDQSVHGHLWYHLLESRRDRRQVDNLSIYVHLCLFLSLSLFVSLCLSLFFLYPFFNSGFS